MEKVFYFSDNDQCDLWDKMWTSRTVDQELEACEIESPPRDLFVTYIPKGGKIIDAGCGFGKWVVTGDLTGKLDYDTKAGVNISLTLDGKEVTKTHVRYHTSGDCMIPISWIFIGVGLTMPYFRKRPRGRCRRDLG